MMRKIIHGILSRLLRVLFRVRVEGLPKNLDSRRLMIIANHESFLDGLLLALYLPFNPVFVVHTGVARTWFFRLVLTQIDHLSVDPSNPIALKKVIKLIEEGRPVVIFPEGRITVTGSLMKVYDGPAFVAEKTGATILPVRLDGPAVLFRPDIRQTSEALVSPRYDFCAAADCSRNSGCGIGKDSQAPGRRSNAANNAANALRFTAKDDPLRRAVEAQSLYGRNRRVVEDMKQIEYSYKDLVKMTLALGRIVAKETAPGECFGIVLPNLAATVCMLIGSGTLRRIPAMLNYKAGKGGMQDACIAAGIKTIFTSKAFVEQAKLEDDLSGIEGVRILYLEDLQAKMSIRDKAWIVKGMLFPGSVGKRVDPDSPAVVLFTSGSEGKPKGVVLSHKAILSNIAQIRSVIDFSVEDKLLNALPDLSFVRADRRSASSNHVGNESLSLSDPVALPGDSRNSV